ncbi:SAV_915 family protein [Amycolatopsis silviterrae]|uniref:SAV_915 family protein n=1 Tax=Amycolatopsis silviterrae TaxID=1656914 RepID=A0ABW5HKF6_9PSEU
MGVPNLPELVYVPCAEHVSDPATARPVMAKAADGRLLMTVYSTPEALNAGWGDNHPWLALPAEHLGELHATQHFDLIAVDPEPANG